MRTFSYLIFLFIFIFNIMMTQNYNYNSEDWYVIGYPGTIVAITEDNFSVYFATNDGFYRYEKISEDFQYDYNLSINNYSSKIRHFYIDPNRGYYWIVDNQGIYFKSSVSSIWREMSILDSGIFNYYEIDDIGSSGKYFWFRSQDELFAYDPYSGMPIKWEEAKDESNMISWGNSLHGISGKNLDISNYFINTDWELGINKIKSNDGAIINVIVSMQDREGNIWYGTDQGYILKSWRSSNNLEIISLGLPFENVTEAYFDDYGNWWFADSKFKRTGYLSNHNRYNVYESSNTSFIAKWHEKENDWTYYRTNESEIIQNQDINCILRINNDIYFGTMYGVLYYNLDNRDWGVISQKDGLNEEAIWEMLEFNGSIFVATASGINEISTINQSVIPDSDNIFTEINKYKIYDMDMDSNYLYIASEIGLIKLNLEEGEKILLSKKHYKNINIQNGLVTASDGSLWKINNINDEKLIKHNVQQYNICDPFLWSVYNGTATLTDTSTQQSWNYNSADGIPGNKIYDINCDQNWVWFLSNKGVAFYNWSRYHKKN